MADFALPPGKSLAEMAEGLGIDPNKLEDAAAPAPAPAPGALPSVT
eukprot:CAMPEP_0119283432 /NCGR_PEP_ID=MMETSP1329-20130426/28482_1 /TAXON_ID=114041 /ORGANISM="Genus nov. species nov., Strain RCC1024" /LENGTH=45 /DNA_ID= /DNA_START= /DNA_END= /DNA_ORIENTATION=